MEEAVAYTTCSEADWDELKTFENLFKEVRGDVASWEKEEGWETVGEVKIVTLRFPNFRPFNSPIVILLLI